MKIGVDIRVLMDEYYSGVSLYAANLLTAIYAQDTENEYKLFYNSWNDLDERLSQWRREKAVIIGSHIPNKIFNYFCQKFFRLPKIDEKIGGVDVFWSPHFNFTSLSDQTKKVVTVHDLSFLRYPEFFSARKNFWHRALGIKRTLLEADKIIAVSENTKNDIVELVGITPDKIKVIYSGNNAVKGEVDPFLVKEFLERHKLSGRLILYLGTIEPRKNISGLISAYNNLRSKNESLADVKLVLAGASGWKNKKIYREWKQSPFKDDIIFLGYISQKDKDILYSASIVFVYPSFYEGFGFPPLEAMTYGLPVICSNVSSLPEVVGDAALTINPHLSAEISDALELILTNDALRQSYISKGYARAGRFTWDKAAAEYLTVFKEL